MVSGFPFSVSDDSDLNTVEQEKFCNNACVERFLKAKGDNVKKAAKCLRSCLSWRESIGSGTFIILPLLLLLPQKVLLCFSGSF